MVVFSENENFLICPIKPTPENNEAKNRGMMNFFNIASRI
jgi:hypothetical protein